MTSQDYIQKMTVMFNGTDEGIDKCRNARYEQRKIEADMRQHYYSQEWKNYFGDKASQIDKKSVLNYGFVPDLMKWKFEWNECIVSPVDCLTSMRIGTFQEFKKTDGLLGGKKPDLGDKDQQNLLQK